MRTLKSLRPGEKGTKELVARYGTSLLCIRSRFDDLTRERVKTVELIVQRRGGSLSASTGKRPICASGSSPPVAGGTRTAGSASSAATTPKRLGFLHRVAAGAGGSMWTPRGWMWTPGEEAGIGHGVDRSGHGRAGLGTARR